jgi:uncharacterized protein (TIGR02246 family)
MAVTRAGRWIMNVGIALAMIGAAVAPLVAQGTPSWAQDVNTKWYAAFDAGDATAIAKFYATDAVVFAQDQTLRGRAAVEAYHAGNFQKTRFKCDWGIDSVQTVGKQTAVLGHDSCVETPKAGGTAKTVKSRWLTIYERQADGSWLMARDASEPVTP